MSEHCPAVQASFSLKGVYSQRAMLMNCYQSFCFSLAMINTGPSSHKSAAEGIVVHWTAHLYPPALDFFPCGVFSFLKLAPCKSPIRCAEFLLPISSLIEERSAGTKILVSYYPISLRIIDSYFLNFNWRPGSLSYSWSSLSGCKLTRHLWSN